MAKYKKTDLKKLYSNIDEINLVDALDETQKAAIVNKVITGYDIDVASRKNWKETAEEGIKVAEQVVDEKTFPWPGAANIKYPMVATAAIQFASRAYPQILDSKGGFVKAKVYGDDPTGAKEAKAARVSKHMSWQLEEQMVEWEPDMDKMLLCLSVAGTWFKKTYRCNVRERNVSESVHPFSLVVNNKHKGDLNTCRRITHEIWLYKNDVKEREFAGLFADGVCDVMQHDEEDAAEQFLEQHMWFDLDGDGYEEPYIAVIHYDTQTLARFVANYEIATIKLSEKEELLRIEKVEYFTKYSFIPSPGGGFYAIGFAHLLCPLNEAISTAINQLLDAGALANTGGGFISRGIRTVGGTMSFKLGEWKQVDVTGGVLKDGIVPLPIREPSNVLFQLLGMLDEAGQKLMSVTDLMSGETPSQNTPATTVLALIEQGLKVFGAIHKRIYRALTEEYKKLYRLNNLYTADEEYFRLLDEQNVVYGSDYNLNDLDVVPTSDPQVSSQAQELARAQALLQTMGMNPNPVAQMEILRQYYEAIQAKNIDILVPPESLKPQPPQQAPPDPALIEAQLKIQQAKDKVKLDLQKQHNENGRHLAELDLMAAQIKEIESRIILNLANAESKEAGDNLASYKTAADMIGRAHDIKMSQREAELAQAETVSAPVEQPAEPTPEYLPAPQEAPAQEPIPVDQPPEMMQPPQEPTPTYLEGGTAPPRPEIEEGMA